jgi:L-amino acid N-acyltransferase YncA
MFSIEARLFDASRWWVHEPNASDWQQRLIRNIHDHDFSHGTIKPTPSFHRNCYFETRSSIMTKPIIRTRCAIPLDVPAIYEIHKHYVLNTVITFKTEVTSEEAHVENLSFIQEQQKLPYLIAEAEDQAIVGYAYVTGFRSGKAGYKHTVELSLFCHPEHLYEGIGTTLLNRLLDVLSSPEANMEFYVSGIREDDQKVRQVIACMAVNTNSKEEGIGLKKWYEGFGFVLKGHLSEVGFKFDQW